MINEINKKLAIFEKDPFSNIGCNKLVEATDLFFEVKEKENYQEWEKCGNSFRTHMVHFDNQAKQLYDKQFDLSGYDLNEIKNIKRAIDCFEAVLQLDEKNKPLHAMKLYWGIVVSDLASTEKEIAIPRKRLNEMTPSEIIKAYDKALQMLE